MYIYNIFKAFKIKNKVNYFIINNTSNNTIIIKELKRLLKFNNPKYYIYYFKYITNLTIKALLFKKEALIFKNLLGLN